MALISSSVGNLKSGFSTHQFESIPDTKTQLVVYLPPNSKDLNHSAESRVWLMLKINVLMLCPHAGLGLHPTSMVKSIGGGKKALCLLRFLSLNSVCAHTAELMQLRGAFL